MMSDNINRLKIIAEGLGELCREVVFVGGSVAELYADDPAASDIRPTMDVDCVIATATYGSMQGFEDLLRLRKFVNDIESGVICRWKYNGEIVDIMPDHDSILGFTNKWYYSGMKHRIEFRFSDGMAVNILPPLYYLATKIEAIRGRGGEDLRFSHDFEDFVYVLNNRRDIKSMRKMHRFLVICQYGLKNCWPDQIAEKKLNVCFLMVIMIVLTMLLKYWSISEISKDLLR